MISALMSLCAGFQAGGSVELIHKTFGVEDYGEFGNKVVRMDDVDLDGTPDYAVAAHRENHNGFVQAGAVRVYSGRSHALISELFGTATREYFGKNLIPMADVNGDGRGDYALSSDSVLPVRIVSAVDGVILHSIARPPLTYAYAYAMADIGDLDGDGKHELAIGDLGVANAFGPEAGIVYLHSGGNFALVATVEGKSAYARLGEALAAAGDLNGDLIPDFFVGAPGHVRSGRGRAFAYSGADLSIIHSFQNNAFEGRFGSSVDAGSDVDGDGVPDLLVGAPFYNSANIHAGTVTVISGATGTLIRQIEAEQQSTGLGSTVRFGSDLDGDGQADILVEELDFEPGSSGPHSRVLVFSSFDYEPLVQFLGDDPSSHGFGSAFAGIEDLNGDGLGEVLVGFPHEHLGTPTRGSVTVFAFRPRFFLSGRALSSSVGGSLTAQVRFPASSAGHIYRILASLSGASPPTTLGAVEVPLVADAAFQSTLSGAFPPFTSGMTGTLDAAGRALASLAPGPGALQSALIGRTVHLAAVEGAGGVPLRSSVQQGFLIVP